MSDKLTVYQDKKGEWRWHLVAPNGEVVAASTEGYKSRSAAVANARRVLGDERVDAAE